MKNIFTTICLLVLVLLTGCAQTPNWHQRYQDPHYRVPDSVQYNLDEIISEKVTYSTDLSSIRLVKKDINQYLVTNVATTSSKNPNLKVGTATFHQGTCSQGFGFLDVRYTTGEHLSYEINYREYKNTRQVDFVKFICSQFQRNVLVK